VTAAYAGGPSLWGGGYAIGGGEMDRSLGGLARALLDLGDPSGPTLVAGRIAGRLPTEVLRDAVAAVAARHPSLRAAVREGQLIALPPEPARIPVHQRRPGPVEGDPRPGWERVVEAELRWPLDLHRGLALRVVHVPEPGGSTVILCAHPALVDAVSLARVLHEVLAEAAARPSVHPPVVARPDLAVAIPAPLRWAAPLLGRVWARDVVGHQQRPVLPAEGAGPMRSVSAFRRGSPAGLRRLRVAAARHRVTVGQVALASLAIALGGGGRVPLDLPVDLRRHGHGVPGDAVGMYAGGVRIHADLRGDVRFWDVARAVGAQVRALVGWRVHLAPLAVAEAGRPAEALESAGADPIRPGAPPALVNVGRWAHRVDHGPFVLRDVYGASGVAPRGSALTVWVHGLPDGLCLGAVGAAPAVSRATTEAILDRVLDLLEHPVADRVDLAEVGRPGVTRAASGG
jgi:hypothetical protein